MALLGLYMGVLLLFTGRVEAGFGIQTFSGSDVGMHAVNAYSCEDWEPTIEITTNLRNINDKGDKVLDMSFQLEEEFNEGWKLTVIIAMWTNGAWDEDFYREEGTPCGFLTKFGEKAWANLRRNIKPTIPEKCLIEVGNYALTDFTINLADVTAPIAVVGKYKVTARFFNSVGEETLCQVVEVEVTPP